MSWDDVTPEFREKFERAMYRFRPILDMSRMELIEAVDRECKYGDKLVKEIIEARQERYGA